MSDANQSADLSAYEAYAQPTEVNTADVLGQISQAVIDLAEARADVTEAEQVLKDRQQRVRTLEEFTIPELMRSVGMEQLKVATGETVELTETLHASIPAANLSQALKWLIDHNQGAIIKRDIKLQFGKAEEEKANAALRLILEAGYAPQDKQSVHPQSLAAVLRELLAAGTEVPMEMLGAYVRSYAKVKPPKK